jgi:4-hydroxy-3-polyprenylbenzoate decarboxylase
MQPHRDAVTLNNRSVGLDPSGAPSNADGIDDNTEQKVFGSALLIDAMRPFDYPPVSLPAKQYMERAKEIWEQLQFPRLTPRKPWHGYELGDWSERDREEAEWAVKGEYHKTGARAAKERKAPQD